MKKAQNYQSYVIIIAYLLPFSSASLRSPTDFFAISRKDLVENAERTDPMRPTLKAAAMPTKATQRRFIIIIKDRNRN